MATGCIYSPPSPIVNVEPSNFNPPKSTLLEVFFKTPLLMEINSVPPPFDVAGNYPYVLWINGRRVQNIPMGELRAVVNKVGKENIKQIDLADIHKGWLTPHYGPLLPAPPQAQRRIDKLNP